MNVLDAYTSLPRFPGKGRGFRLLTRALPYASAKARHLDGVRLYGQAGDLTFMFSTMLRGNDLIGRTIRSYPADTTFVDIGANIGAYTLLAARRFVEGWVYAIEPHPITFAYLARNVALNRARNVTLCCAAVDHADQRMVTLSFDPHHSGGASLAMAHAKAIDVLTINRNWFANLRDLRSLLVKIDVEGAEATVVREVLSSPIAGAISGFLVEISRQRGANEVTAMMDEIERAGLHEVERVPATEADNVLFKRA